MPRHPLRQFAGFRRRTSLQHDTRDDDFAPAVVGHAEDGGIRNLLATHQHLFHLQRIDVLATRLDEVLLAIDHPDPPPGLPFEQVAGVMPRVAQRIGGRLRVIPVAKHDGAAADAEFADAPRAHFPIALVGDHIFEERHDTAVGRGIAADLV